MVPRDGAERGGAERGVARERVAAWVSAVVGNLHSGKDCSRSSAAGVAQQE